MDNDVREEQVCLSVGTHRTTFAIKGSYQEKSESGFLTTASRIRLNHTLFKIDSNWRRSSSDRDEKRASSPLLCTLI